MNLFERLFNEIILENALWYSTTQSPRAENLFEDALFKMYEFEYKLQATRTWEFNGTPKRLENITKGLTEELIKATEYVKSILLETFEEWLKSHALLKPEIWAVQRFKQYGDDTSLEDMFENIIYDYWDYRSKLGLIHSNSIQDFSRNKIVYFREIIESMTKDINKFPHFKQYIESTILPSQIEFYQEEFNDNAEDFKERHNFKTDEEAQKYIDNLTIDDIDIGDTYYVKSPASFMEAIGEFNNEAILIEMFEHIIFPLWFKFWEQRGIVDTRDNVQDVYDNLKATTPHNLGNLISWTNAALNTAHQTGPMLDYVEQLVGSDNLKSLLDDLTNNNHEMEWQDELVENGFRLINS